MTPPNACSDFFSANAKDPQKVKSLQAQQARWAWESLSASAHSPGVVQAEETLARMIFTPHWDPVTNKPTPNAIEDAANKGLSVDRLLHATLAYVQRRAEEARAVELVQAEQGRVRRLESIMWLKASAVRAIQWDGKQAFGIFDTALPDNRAHADVCQLVPGKQAWRSIKASLYKLLSA